MDTGWGRGDDKGEEILSPSLDTAPRLDPCGPERDFNGICIRIRQSFVGVCFGRSQSR